MPDNATKLRSMMGLIVSAVLREASGTWTEDSLIDAAMREALVCGMFEECDNCGEPCLLGQKFCSECRK